MQARPRTKQTTRGFKPGAGGTGVAGGNVSGSAAKSYQLKNETQQEVERAMELLISDEPTQRKGAKHKYQKYNKKRQGPQPTR